jgi:hypothetical protein
MSSPALSDEHSKEMIRGTSNAPCTVGNMKRLDRAGCLFAIAGRRDPLGSRVAPIRSKKRGRANLERHGSH